MATPPPTAPTTPAQVPVAVESSAYLAAVAAASSLQQSFGTSLETFDLSGGSLGGAAIGWTFELGREFPGARGTLTLAGGESGMGASMLADLNCGSATIQLTPSGCGKYVAMTRGLGSLYGTATPETAMLGASVQVTHPLISTGLRVVDGTGQTLQYAFAPGTLETSAGATWAKVMIPLGSSNVHWSGANDGKLYGGITRFSFTGSTPVVAAPAASVKVDNVRLLDSGITTYALSRQSALLKDGVRPSTNGRLAVATHFNQASDRALSQAAEVGISVVRMDLYWRLVESGGKFNFSIYEAILQRLAKQGQSALFILDYGHPDHGGGGAPLNPGDRAAFLEFSRQATLFAKGRNVVGFEVWNEPDHPNFWTDGDPDTYAQLLAATRQVIKATDSTRKVVNGGTAWVNLPYILRLAKTGALNNLDGFAIHAYRPWAPETFAPEVAHVKAILASQGVINPSLWITEWGYSSFGNFDTAVYGNGLDPRARGRQAVLTLRKVLTETALNLPMSTLYELADSGADGNHSEHNFGLLTNTYEPKPAHTALKTLYSFTKTRNYVGLVRDVPANVHAMRWDGSDDSVFAVWVDSANVPLTLVLPKAATVTSLSGSAVATQATGNSATSQVKVTEAAGPVFVRFPITALQ